MTMQPDIPDWLANTQPISMMAPKTNLPMQIKPKGGMFGGGGKFGLREALAFGLAGLVARRNPMLLQGLLGMMMQKQRDAGDEQRRQIERQQGLEDYRTKLGIQSEFDRPRPSEFERMAAAAGIMPGSPEFQALAKQFVQNKANPFVQMRVQNPDGSESLQFMRPPSIPTAPVGRLTPLDEGGPSLGGSGGFPGPY